MLYALYTSLSPRIGSERCPFKLILKRRIHIVFSIVLSQLLLLWNRASGGERDPGGASMPRLSRDHRVTRALRNKHVAFRPLRLFDLILDVIMNVGQAMGV